jgi:hypothetical protein
MDDELLPGVDGNQRSGAESGAGSSDDGLDEDDFSWCLAGESQEPDSVSDVEACVLELCASVRDDATRAGRRHVGLHIAGFGDGLDEVPVRERCSKRKRF